MQKNSAFIYDVAIIGASQDGIDTAIQLRHRAPNLKIALISSSFDKLANSNKLSVDKIKAKVIFSEYRKRLIILTLNNRSNIFCTNLIIATGTTSTQLTDSKKNLNVVNNIYYKLSDIPRQKLSKNNQIIVVGNSQEAVKSALALSKKVTYVYLCNKDFKLNCDTQSEKQLKTTDNIAYLPGSNIISFIVNKDQTVTSVTLDTYSKIHCTGILVQLGAQVDNSGIANNMITTNDSQQILVDKNCQTTIIPNIYAIGSCSTRPANAARLRMIDMIIKSNN